MKQKVLLINYSVLLLSVFLLSHSLQNELKVGAIFGKSDEDKTLESAFKYALYQIKHSSEIRSSIKVSYIVESLESFNTFNASKKVCNIIKQGALVLFGPIDLNLALYVNSLSYTLKLPQIDIRQDLSRDKSFETFSVNLYPDPVQVGRSYTDLILRLKWESFVIYYDDQDSLFRVQSIIGAKFKGTSVSIRQVTKETMRLLLIETKMADYYKIFADLSLENTKLLLRTALQQGMINSFYSYIFSNLDLHMLDLEDFKHNYANIHMFRLINNENSKVKSILKKMQIYELQTELKILNKTNQITHQAALMHDAVMLLQKALKDLDEDTSIRIPVNISCENEQQWPDGHTLLSFLNRAKIDGLTGKVSMNHGRRLHFVLDITSLTKEGLTAVGTWSTRDGIKLKTPPQSSFVPHLYNESLIVTSIVEPPYLMYKEGYQKFKGNDRFEGFCVDMLKSISEKVGFQYRIQLVQDGQYGSRDDDQQWNGMVRELIDKKADLAVAPLTISYPREQVIDFTKPYLSLGIGILFRVPKPEKPGLFSFMNPLAPEIWLYVVGSYIIVSVTIFVLARFSPYEWYNPHPCNAESDTVQNDFSLCNSLWFTVGTLMHQGSDITPKAVSTRIAGGIWWFFTLIIIASYTANLAAFLTVERMVSPITNAEDLSKQTKISYGALANGSTMTFFKTSTIETFKRMWTFMKKRSPSVFTKTNNEGVERVLQGNYAYLMESTMLEYTLQQNCSLMQVGGLLDNKGYGIGTQINSPLRDRLSLAILELQEHGVIMEMYNKWWKNTRTCADDDPQQDTKAVSLNMENVGGIFVVLMGGLTFAVLVALAEFTWNSKRNASFDKQSVCTEMGEELRFAVRCQGGTQKVKTKKPRRCSRCYIRQSHRHSDCFNIDSPNGMIQEMPKSPLSVHKQPTRQWSEGDNVIRSSGGGEICGFLRAEYSETKT